MCSSKLVGIVVLLLLVVPIAHAADADRDGIEDSVDNCPDYWNADQYDADGDGIGNVCDECTDYDGDGYGDPGFPTNTCPEDNCPGYANPDQLDTDGDGVGDTCEAIPCGDWDGSGDYIMDIADLIWAVSYFLGGPAPISMGAANANGCNGVDFHDMIYEFGFMSSDPPWRCDDVAACPAVPIGAISLDHTDGLVGPDTIPTEQTVTFYLRFTGHPSEKMIGMANGFRVHSPTGAEWSGTEARELIDMGSTAPWGGFDLLHHIRRFGMTGSGADSIGLTYYRMSVGGLPAGFDSVTHSIEIGPIPNEYSGGEICLDSCWFPPGGSWVWGAMWLYDDAPFSPSWDGPHCFTIFNCCVVRGDINNDGSDPDIADLIYMVTFMFQDGPPPPCMAAIDINGDGQPEPDIADLIYLVTNMFQDGPPPAACPE